MAMIDAVPHDLLKVIDWSKHATREAVKSFIPSCASGKYKVPCKDILGNEELRDLESIIEKHHSTESFWSRQWAYADRLSTAAGRFRLEYDYWYYADGNPFIVKAYGDIKEWTREKREKASEMIASVLKMYCDIENGKGEAFRKINEVLSDFPADSRFPVTSLKTHHWLTDVIRRDETFWKKCVEATELSKDPSFDKLFIVRISISQVQFHRLKEIRSFVETRKEILRKTNDVLSMFSPLQIGEDMYVVCLEDSSVHKVLKFLADSGFGFDVTVFEWTLTREEKRVRPNGKSERIYFIKDCVERPQLSIGVYEDFGNLPEKVPKFSEILEDKQGFVAWICIEPKGDMKYLSQIFLNWCEYLLKARYHNKRMKLEESVEEPTSFLSPEIALSIADGYEEFLECCVKVVSTDDSESCVVTRSFDRTILIRQTRNYYKAFQVYNSIASIKSKLHIPSVFSVVVTKPKYPFWRILEMSRYEEDCLVFVVGEKMVRLTNDVVKLLYNVTDALKNTSRSQFNEIIRATRRVDLEELKFIINGKAADGKIPSDASRKLCWLIDELSKRYEGNDLKSVLWRCFKSLEPYTRKEVKKWHQKK